MNKPLFLFAALSIVMFSPSEVVKAQDITGGVVKYEQITRMDFSAMFSMSDNPQMANNPRIKDMIASMPREQRANKVLYFEQGKSLYKGEAPGDNAVEVSSGGYKMVFIGMGGGGSKATLQQVYYDFDKGKKTEQVGFMTRDFIVSDKITPNAWKLTSRVSTILGYTCTAAELVDGEKLITAWFASELPFSTGPDKYYGLPGLILAVEIDGETALIAKSISLDPPGKKMLAKPKKGKKVTPAKLEKIIAEKLKELKETSGGRREYRVVH